MPTESVQNENAQGSQPTPVAVETVRTSDTKQKKNVTGGVILIVLGVLFLLDNLLPSFDIGQLWPVILIVIGLSILFKGRER
jgi:uncharacterized membrane protein